MSAGCQVAIREHKRCKHASRAPQFLWHEFSTWKVRYDATIALLALGGCPPAQLQHSGPSGEPLDMGAPAVVILPSDGYEIQLGPDGKPLLSVDEDFDEEPPLLPPQGPHDHNH